MKRSSPNEPGISSFLVTHFGLAFLTLWAVLTYVALLFRPVGLHYQIFTGAARAFWAERAIYGTSGVPGWFYSPNCAAFYYGLFAFLPPALGRALYVGSCLLVLAAAVYWFRKEYENSCGRRFDGTPAGQIVWLMLASEINGAILAEKLEILILALFLMSLCLCWRGRYLLATALLTVVANWKFQSLPLLGLLCLVFYGERKAISALGVFLVLSVALFFSPFSVKSPTYLWTEIGHWGPALSTYIQEAWQSPIFHHLYSFLAKALGIQVPYPLAQKLSAAAGAVFASWVLLQGYWGVDLRLRFATVFGLGSAYAVIFSPLSQGTGFLLYLPLPMLAVMQSQFGSYFKGNRDRWLWVVLLLAYYFVSLSVSDLTPPPLRNWFYNHGFKVVGAIILVALVAYREASIRNQNLSAAGLRHSHPGKTKGTAPTE